VKWFGKSNGAPVCHPTQRIAWVRVPAFCKLCFKCKQPIGEEQCGIMVPYVGPERTVLTGWHMSCFAQSLGVPNA
jgi:hypothetical protein